MRLTFLGAAGEVTGSATLVETGQARVLIDFGLHQGGREADTRNRRRPPLDAQHLDAVVLTHAHIDHSGRLPLLVRPRKDNGFGYPGPIVATPATIELADILLRDAAHLQQMDAERESRRRLRGGRSAVAPLFNLDDAERALAQMRPLAYETEREIAPGVSILLRDAGHILGSASVLMRIKPPNGAERVIAFSADVGVKDGPLLRNPRSFESADAVVLESTYGDRDHRPIDRTLDEFVEVLAEAESHDGKVLIPAFAVGRTQALIFYLGRLRREGRLGDTPVYIDSPMATETTELYRRHPECFDEESRRLLEGGASGGPLSFPGLRFTRSSEESRRLNDLNCCAIIISASGMCTGGRILHHLKHSLWKRDTHVVIVGFQAAGTLGRQLVDGARRVTILHEPIAVKARIHTLGGFSAHAGRSGLLDWLRPLAGARPRVFLTHGEDKPRQSLAQAIGETFGIPAVLPRFGEETDLP